jgi:hypothetical protein
LEEWKEGRKGFCWRNLFSYKIANQTGRLKKKKRIPVAADRETMSEVSQSVEGLNFGGGGGGGR